MSVKSQCNCQKYDLTNITIRSAANDADGMGNQRRLSEENVSGASADRGADASSSQDSEQEAGDQNQAESEESDSDEGEEAV